MRYDGIMFDLDGTLWNATDALTEAWRLTVEGEPDVKRAPTTEELKGVMGMTDKDLMATLFPYLSEERNAELFEKSCRVEHEYLSQHGGTLYPQLEEVLQKLSENVPLFIVSNCGCGYIEAFLAAHKLEKYFKDFECVGNTGLLKCDNIKLVAERNGLSVPVYVGDTQLDCDSATKAGVPFIFAAYGFGNVNGTEKINSLPELLELV